MSTEGENSGDTARGKPAPKVALGTIARSILAAAFGVQSRRNQERDFVQGNYRHYIVGGILFTILFVATVATVVTLVLRSSGSH